MTGRVSGGRHRAREALFRIAFQADRTGDAWSAAWGARRHDEHLTEDQGELVAEAVALFETRGSDVDALLGTAAEHWSLDRLAATDRAVLRAAVAELLARPGTPARVILDEAIELARRYGSEDSGRFVNGVLDRVARRERPEEF